MGSEMCIRDSNRSTREPCSRYNTSTYPFREWELESSEVESSEELESARGSELESESELVWAVELAPE